MPPGDDKSSPRARTPATGGRPMPAHRIDRVRTPTPPEFSSSPLQTDGSPCSGAPLPAPPSWEGGRGGCGGQRMGMTDEPTWGFQPRGKGRDGSR